MNKYFDFVLFLISLSLLTSSCTEKIDINLKNSDELRLIVDGRITNKPGPHLVRLTLSAAYFYNSETPRATGALVEISDGVQTIGLTEVSAGNYYTPATFMGEIGKTYTLKISYDSKEYNASCLLAAVSNVDSVGQSEDNENENSYFVTLFAQETVGIGNYYLWETHVNGIDRTAKLGDKIWASDELVDGNYIDGFALDNIGVGKSDTVLLQMYSIPEIAFQYFEAVMLETDWRGSPFDGPPANVPTNISNGGLGLFYAAALSEGTTIIK